MVREILVNWSTPAGADQVSVMHFLTASPVVDQRAALAAFLTAAEPTLAATTSWSIATEGRELNIASGALEGAWSEPTAHTGSGDSGNTQSLADATQVLMRWNTGNIINGRFLKGRTNLPGIGRLASDNGNLRQLDITALTTAGQTFADSAVQFAIWSRPTNGVGGAAFAVETASVWPEFAVQRRRRK